MQSEADQRVSLRAAFAVAFGLAGVFLLGALTTVVAVPLIERAGPGWSDVLLRKGPHRLAGRVTMFWLLVYLPFLLKWIGWTGRRDTGWKASGRDAWRDAGAGFAIGAAAMFVIVAVMSIVGNRVPAQWEGMATLIGLLLKFTASCLVVALIEETLARGIFFRCLARVWGGITAAMVVSLLFGVLHFARPLPEAFAGGPLLPETFRVLASMGANVAQTPDVVLRVVNLSLMSLVLCALVHRTGTIWAAVGVHAGFVWIKHLNGFLTDTASGTTAWAWLGHKADAVDSPAGTAVLLALLVLALVVPMRRTSTS